MRHLLLVLCLPLAAAAAEVYQWRDAEGRLHFSDQPPGAGEGQQVEVETSEGLRFAEPAAVRAQEQRLADWEAKERREQQAALESQHTHLAARAEQARSCAETRAARPRPSATSRLSTSVRRNRRRWMPRPRSARQCSPPSASARRAVKSAKRKRKRRTTRALARRGERAPAAQPASFHVPQVARKPLRIGGRETRRRCTIARPRPIPPGSAGQ